ncbi:MAG TPA: hypothetical protein VGP07_07165 [Polyangia bacterium]
MRTLSRSTLAVAILASLFGCSKKQNGDVTVTWSDTKQSIDGFGASSAFFGGTITNDQADQLFDAKKGIGLSLLRTMIGVPDDTMDDGSEPTDNTKPVATAPELATAQQAASRGVRIWAAAWTPPPIWKTTNNKRGSDPTNGYTSNKLQTSHYQDFANYLADFVDLMSAANVPIFGLSPANEPDYVPTWDGAQWSPDELTTFIGQNLGPTFAQRAASVKILAPETASFPSCAKYVPPLMADSAAKSYVSIVATHPYSAGDLSFNLPQQNGKQFWETEWSQENSKGDTPDPGMTSAIDMAKHIHDHMVTTGMNAWNWWAIYINKDGLNDNTRLNPAFIQPDGDLSGAPYMFKRGFAFGNWSKFVRPGFQRIGATDHPTGNVLIEAYRDSSHLAVIAVNTGSTKVTQKFKIEGASFGTLTPWVTSNGDSLASKSTIDGGDGFSYDLPANSVVTFVNWDANNETPGLTIPNADGGTDSSGSGGSTGSGGTSGGSGGATGSGGLDCNNAVVPANVDNGGVTDFSDWKGSTGKWGSTSGLYGAIYSYQGPNGSTMSANVDTANKDFHITGSVTMGDYGGAGLGFYTCATVASFSQVQFTLAGSSPGCDLELQLKTFDQQPTSQTPAGGCDMDAGSCYNFPVLKQIAVPSSTATTVTANLSDFTNWSSTTAGQVVGMQWQFTGTNIPTSDPDAATSDSDPDAGATSDAAVGCPIDVTVTNIKFLP